MTALMRPRVMGLLALVSAVLLLAGCGSGKPATVPVSGVVKVDGKPMEGATVTFMPKAGGRPATGVSDASGKYTLTTFQGGDGALAGEHAVIVTKIKQTGAVGDKSGSPPDGAMLSGPSAGKVEYEIPQKYATPENSGLKAEVKAGMPPVDFDLSSK